MSLAIRLSDLGLFLPTPAVPAGSYLPVKRVGNLIYVSGQLPLQDGKLLATGPVPSRCSMAQAQLAARQCVLNALGAIAAVESTESLTGVLRVGAFIHSDNGFTQQSQVANAASDLLVELFGSAGRHVRAAVGVNTLPLDASVEIEFVFLG